MGEPKSMAEALGRVIAALEPLDKAQREAVLRGVARDLGLDQVEPLGEAHTISNMAPVNTMGRELDNQVVSWWLDWTERYQSKRLYPDVMTNDGVTTYHVDNADDFASSRDHTEACARRIAHWSMRQALAYHGGVWTWRIHWREVVPDAPPTVGI